MATPRAEAQHALRPLRAAMSRALGLDQTAIKGMRRRQSLQRFGDGVQDHGQFVVELVGGRSHHGCGTVGSSVPLHVRRIIARCGARAARRVSMSCKRWAWQFTTSCDRQAPAGAGAYQAVKRTAPASGRRQAKTCPTTIAPLSSPGRLPCWWATSCHRSEA